MLVDAAQSVAHIPLDVHELGADFLAFSAHKVYGPMGLGVLYAADEVASQMQPTSVGGGAIAYSSLDDFRTREFPSGFEAGTQRVQQAVGFGAVCEWLNQLNMASVQQHGQAIATYAIERLGQLPYVSIYGEHSDANEVCGLVSFAVAGVNPHVVSALLSQMDVSVRGNTLCAAPLMHAMGLLGTVRASFGIYTTCDQIDLLIEGIQRAHLRISGKPMRW